MLVLRRRQRRERGEEKRLRGVLKACEGFSFGGLFDEACLRYLEGKLGRAGYPGRALTALRFRQYGLLNTANQKANNRWIWRKWLDMAGLGGYDWVVWLILRASFLPVAFIAVGFPAVTF